MMKTKRIDFRIQYDDYEKIKSLAESLGFKTTSEFIRYRIQQDPYEKKIVEIENLLKKLLKKFIDN